MVRIAASYRPVVRLCETASTLARSAAVQSAVTGPANSTFWLIAAASRPLTSYACTESEEEKSPGAVASTCQPEPQPLLSAAMVLPHARSSGAAAPLASTRTRPSTPVKNVAPLISAAEKNGPTSCPPAAGPLSVPLKKLRVEAKNPFKVPSPESSGQGSSLAWHCVPGTPCPPLLQIIPGR